MGVGCHPLFLILQIPLLLLGRGTRCLRHKFWHYVVSPVGPCWSFMTVFRATCDTDRFSQLIVIQIVTWLFHFGCCLFLPHGESPSSVIVWCCRVFFVCSLSRTVEFFWGGIVSHYFGFRCVLLVFFWVRGLVTLYVGLLSSRFFLWWYVRHKFFHAIVSFDRSRCSPLGVRWWPSFGPFLTTITFNIWLSCKCWFVSIVGSFFCYQWWASDMGHRLLLSCIIFSLIRCHQLWNLIFGGTLPLFLIIAPPFFPFA